MKHTKVLLGTVTCGGSVHHELGGEPRIKMRGERTGFAYVALGSSPGARAVATSPCLGVVALAAQNDNYDRKAELILELSRQSVDAPLLSSDCAKTAIPSLRKMRLRIGGSVPKILALKKRASLAAVAEPKALDREAAERPVPEPGAAQPHARELKTRKPKPRDHRVAEQRITEKSPALAPRPEPKSPEMKTEEPKRPETKAPKADTVFTEPIKLETLAKMAFEPEQPVRLEIPAHVAVKVIPTPRKRETKQAETVMQPPPELPTTRPLKVIRKRREEAPKVFETIATSVPQAMLVGIASLRDEGEPK